MTQNNVSLGSYKESIVLYNVKGLKCSFQETQWSNSALVLIAGSIMSQILIIFIILPYLLTMFKKF